MGARKDLGIRASCLLAALGYAESDDDVEEAKAFTGALYLAEGLHDLSLIRQRLTNG